MVILVVGFVTLMGALQGDSLFEIGVRSVGRKEGRISLTQADYKT